MIHNARPDDGFEGEELGGVHDGDATAGRGWSTPCAARSTSRPDLPRSASTSLSSAQGTTVAAAVSHPPTGELYWSAGGDFGVLGRGSSAPPAPNRAGQHQRRRLRSTAPFVGAQLAADSDFRAVFNPRIESTTLALAWVASGQRLGYVTDGRLARAACTSLRGSPCARPPGASSPTSTATPCTPARGLDRRARQRLPCDAAGVWSRGIVRADRARVWSAPRRYTPAVNARGPILREPGMAPLVVMNVRRVLRLRSAAHRRSAVDGRRRSDHRRFRTRERCAPDVHGGDAAARPPRPAEPGGLVAVGLLLLGLPGVLMSLSDALGAILGALGGPRDRVRCPDGSPAVLRSPPSIGAERRGEAIGAYGLAVAVPNLVLLPAGPLDRRERRLLGSRSP